MSSFLFYNSDDPNTGNTPLVANAVVTLGPVMAGVATKVAGSVFADQVGTVQVQQSFDYFATGGQLNATPHWDIIQPTGGQSIVAGTPYTIDFDVLAPVIQVVYTNGGVNQGHLRIFLRVYKAALA